MDDCGIYGIVRTEDTLSGALNGADSIQGQIKAQGVLVGEVGFPKCVVDIYDGEYEVTPKVHAQTLDTDGKTMRADVNVKAIPYYETSNLSGETVYIANEL